MNKIIKLLKKDTNNLENIIYRKKYIGLTKIFIIYNETLVSSDKVSDFIIRSLDVIVQEGIQAKLSMMPESVRYKLCQTLTKIINKGSSTMIAIVI